MNIHKLYGYILPFFRSKRLRWFQTVLRPDASTTMIDVGGYPWCWPPGSLPSQITFINLDYPPGLEKNLAPGHKLVKGDGCQLKFPDGSFDIAYSNSVIEHLGTLENQQRFANELRRVGRRLWVQTPARWFIVEPHLLAPFIHYLPKSIQRRLTRYCTGWGLITKPTRQEVNTFLDEIRLLTYAEMLALFPDCKIYRERFCGMTKSYIAVR